jgi:hypothetical protein
MRASTLTLFRALVFKAPCRVMISEVGTIGARMRMIAWLSVEQHHHRSVSALQHQQREQVSVLD